MLSAGWRDTRMMWWGTWRLLKRWTRRLKLTTLLGKVRLIVACKLETFIHPVTSIRTTRTSYQHPCKPHPRKPPKRFLLFMVKRAGFSVCHTNLKFIFFPFSSTRRAQNDCNFMHNASKHKLDKKNVVFAQSSALIRFISLNLARNNRMICFKERTIVWWWCCLHQRSEKEKFWKNLHFSSFERFKECQNLCKRS